ncbi:MAG: redox-regulated ATPase YchF, partial [Oscillospiraceae bacterium]
EKLYKFLEEGKPARGFIFTEEEKDLLNDFSLLSLKPVIYAANLSEKDYKEDFHKNPYYKRVCEIAAAENSQVVPICAKIEE